MVIKKKPKTTKITIDLTGPQGNAFCLLAYAKDFCKQLGRDWDSVSKEMKSGDYENLVNVFDREFGSFVTLYR